MFLTTEIKDLYNENVKAPKKEIRKDTKRLKTSLAQDLAESILQN